MKDSVLDFASLINSKFGENMAVVGEGKQFLEVPRMSSGVLSFDVASGGGWPFNRVCSLIGMESSAKTFMCLKAAQQIEKYDHKTKLPQYLMEDPSEFVPGTCLFVDAECSFDIPWAESIAGFDVDHHLLVRPDYGEQTVDIVTLAIEENKFDLIIVDSLDALVPKKELEESVESNQMGKKPMLISRAFRRWCAGLNKVSHNDIGPAVICINQLRASMALFGNPETVPGGFAQKFYSSIVVRMKSAKIEDGCEKESAYGNYGGVCVKNKTHTPRRNFAFSACVADGEEVPKGTVNNEKNLFAEGLRHGIIKKDGALVRFGKWETKTQKAMKEKIAADPEVQQTLWDKIIELETGYKHGKAWKIQPIPILSDEEETPAGKD